MNQRIQELAEKAKLSVPHGIMGVDKWIEVYNEKFAELIVRECADFLKDTLDDHFAAEQLEEHFGVKE